MSSSSSESMFATFDETLVAISSVFPFNDVADNHWGRDFIHNMYDRNVVSGRGGGIFAPNDDATIAEFLAMAIRLADIRLYADVTNPHWSARYINFALSNQLFSNIDFLSGLSLDDAVVVTNDLSISREFAFYLLHGVFSTNSVQGWSRLRLSYEDRDEVLGFNDGTEVSYQFRPAINALTQVGVVTGRPGAILAPSEGITRAEVTALLFKMGTPEGSLESFHYLYVNVVNTFGVLDEDGTTVMPGVSYRRLAITVGAGTAGSDAGNQSDAGLGFVANFRICQMFFYYPYE
ncbi:MAG: S-layer homology domain-containing protein [Defluviitaleaceae bacterium]|nr:S-layer homology domain-containing protein [Defluviitaleaceae bacterium]MCL2263264.1 S-layer homology domain-containing protein [Defluviitaleaceae bacterium]